MITFSGKKIYPEKIIKNMLITMKTSVVVAALTLAFSSAQASEFGSAVINSDFSVFRPALRHTTPPPLVLGHAAPAHRVDHRPHVPAGLAGSDEDDAAAAESVFVLTVLKKSPPGESRKSFGRDKVPGARTAALNLTGDCYLDTANMCDRS